MPILTALLLAALTFALAAPVPRALAQARWPYKNPGLALALWQAIALSGGLTLIATIFFIAQSFDIFALQLFFGLIGTFIFGWLIYVLFREIALNKKERDKHKHLLYLLTEESPDNTRILDYETPVAYCLPGIRSKVTVLSRGLLTSLDPYELDAVRKHEDAHLNQYHHLLTTAFSAWRKSITGLPSAKMAQQQVATLIEILADRNATKYYNPRLVAQALVNTAGTSMNPLRKPNVQYVETIPTAERIKALLTPPEPLPLAQKIAVIGIIILLLAIPFASYIILYLRQG
ncbi:MAG: M56 family metallopeptidase [Micrococcaceae bacterium]